MLHPSTRQTLLVLDDHSLVRMGICSLVAEHFSEQLQVIEATTLEQGLALLRSPQAQVAAVLLDLQLPDAKGFGGLLALRSSYPAIPVLVLSGAQNERVREEALRLGATSYVSKAISATERGGLLPALQTLCQLLQSTHLSPTQPARCQTWALSPRQVHVLELLLAGQDNQAISIETGLQLGTIKNYVSAIFLTLNVRSRAELMAVFPS